MIKGSGASTDKTNETRVRYHVVSYWIIQSLADSYVKIPDALRKIRKNELDQSQLYLSPKRYHLKRNGLDYQQLHVGKR